ncbi:cation efflux protein/ zinc transporter-like protein [Aaosphaeria arxii CBS 175.79]|uniref:Cation efflux protein/ zinc transporter-like protein n=1 Tax=Aaosphaeria arxii CBS 175.79 TaxID=1450172 RepID=A0A6A5Y3C5_9PLEO|nr:cation efflux protein/ zinc transporter-like protein [Aaosphaeria arxii CBS 175.79]KAF2019779.1 cation efflux protein/ zinc transporter-like protein [Aaosphaeria arxii CBS 175.79]
MARHFELSRKTRLRAVIAISFAFFLAEISTGFYTRSLALIADAFHYLNDLIGFIVALVAVQVTERKESPQDLSFGWARAQLLGAFFNGAFLLALGLSIFVQSIERFISIERVEQPKIVLIVGCIGLTLNIISALFLHEHDHGHGHSHGHGHDHDHAHADHPRHSHSIEEADIQSEGGELKRHSSAEDHASHNHATIVLKPQGIDLGILGVLIHLVGDAINNIGVIIAALIIWLTKSEGRFYADPAVSTWIAIMILLSAVPLTKRSGRLLLQSAPPGIKIDDIKHDLESLPGVKGVHELHVWQLDQKKAIASAHVVVDEESLKTFMQKAQTFSECLHAYGIHSATLQPELVRSVTETGPATAPGGLEHGERVVGKCALTCGTLCEPLTCCS